MGYDYRPPPGDPEILYLDEAIIVSNKMSGLLSVPGRGESHQDCLIHRVQQNYPDALTVHRLDMDTSGLLLLARGPEMQSALSRAFMQRSVNKRYVAVVDGLLDDQYGEINLPLICDWPNRPKQKVDHEIGKPSLTRYRVLATYPENQTTRVDLEPVTGRSHQLRVHLASLGHPILGDDLYGGIAHAKATRLLLHACNLAFIHPLTAQNIEFHSPAPF